MPLSPGLARRALAAVVSVALGLAVSAPTVAQAATPRSGDPNTIAYPLRHSFSLVPGLPGAGKHEPTSCYNADDGQSYLCRIVSGYEEGGDNKTFFVAADDVLQKGSDPTYGMTLVNAAGTQYEGCAWFDPYTYWCDYASRMHVSRQHHQAGHWVLNVLWSWRKYTQGQAGCAAALSGFWEGAARKAFITMLENCLNAPMERPS